MIWGGGRGVSPPLQGGLLCGTLPYIVWLNDIHLVVPESPVAAKEGAISMW